MAIATGPGTNFAHSSDYMGLDNPAPEDNGPAGYIQTQWGPQPYWMINGQMVDSQGLPLNGSPGTPLSPLASAAQGRSLDYWGTGASTRAATTPEEVQQKLDAYYRATAAGGGGPRYPSREELALIGGEPTTNYGALKNFVSPIGLGGAGIGGEIGGPLGAVAGLIAGGAANAAVGAAGQPNKTAGAAAYGGGVQGGATPGLSGAGGNMPVLGGYGSVGGSDPYLDALKRYETGVTGANNEANQSYDQLMGQIYSQIGATNAADYNALGGYMGAIGAANNANNASLNQYTSSINGLNAQNAAVFGGYAGLYSSLANPLTATPWAGPVSSDPESLGMQRQVYGQLQGVASGSLDYQSQAAQAYADPAAISAQWQALNQMQGAAAGNLNIRSQAASAMADHDAIVNQQRGIDALWDAANGSYDVPMNYEQREAHNQNTQNWGNVMQGAFDVNFDPSVVAAHEKQLKNWGDVFGGSMDVQRDPALLARQNEALDQYDQWRNPELTAQERFMQEQMRLEQEQSEKASRDAVYQNLADRGMGGSGLELANMQLGSQQNSQNRLLGDLGAQANAIQRAGAALAGYGQLSGAMQDQFLSNQHANVDTRMQGLAGLGQENQFWGSLDNSRQQGNMDRRTAGVAGLSQENQFYSALDMDRMQSNANRSMGALGLYTDAAGQLRSQTFDEAYKRGLAGDQAAMFNANLQLQASGMSADQANQIRNASFNEAYSRGIAADNASANNQSTRLTGMTSAGNLATSMRTQADAITMFNAEQQAIQQRFQDTFAQNERDSQWNRADGLLTQYKNIYADPAAASATGIFGAQTGTTQTNLWNTGAGYNALTGYNNTALGRNLGAIGTQIGLVGTQQGNNVASANASKTVADAIQGRSLLGQALGQLGGGASAPVNPAMPGLAPILDPRSGTPTYRKAF